MGFAQQRHGEAVQPVPGDGLLEIHQAEQVRHDPVAALDHLAADLRVAGFIGYPQAALCGGEQVRGGEQQHKQAAPDPGLRQRLHA
jgi:hypothetical protein